MVRQRGGVREPRGASREQEDSSKSRLPRVRPVFLILGFLSLVIVITVFLSTRPRAANRLPDWLSRIKVAEGEARTPSKGEFQEVEEFIDLWSKGTVADLDEEEEDDEDLDPT